MAWRSVISVALGSCFLHTLHTVTLNSLKSLSGSSIPEWKVLLIAEELLVSVNALFAVIVGWYTVTQTSHDVIRARCPLVKDWTWFLMMYFLYDLWAMYRVHAARTAEVPQQTVVSGGGGDCRAPSVPLLRRVRSFMRAKSAMIIHHLVLTFLGGPVALHFRGDRGDFMVGCFFLLELSTPFVALRAVLSAFDKKNTRLYKVNGYCMMTAFFVCRILIFPFMYWACSKTLHTSFLEVFVRVPWYCHLGNSMVLGLQLYWFSIMVNGAVRALRSGDMRLDEKRD